jgi:hypothetical protein
MTMSRQRMICSDYFASAFLHSHCSKEETDPMYIGDGFINGSKRLPQEGESE